MPLPYLNYVMQVWNIDAVILAGSEHIAFLIYHLLGLFMIPRLLNESRGSLPPNSNLQSQTSSFQCKLSNKHKHTWFCWASLTAPVRLPPWLTYMFTVTCTAIPAVVCCVVGQSAFALPAKRSGKAFAPWLSSMCIATSIAVTAVSSL